MNKFQKAILDPIIKKILNQLEGVDVLSILDKDQNGFLNLINKLRAREYKNIPSLADITKEVKIVRTKEYADTKK